jgi:hypothetical protein
MGRNVSTLGGGTSDTGGSFWNTGAGGDLTSDVTWTNSDTVAYLHGGFGADGYTLNTTVRPINVVDLSVRVGGDTTSVGGGVSNATIYAELATAASGSGGYNDSGNTRVTTSTTVTHTTGTIDWNVVAGTTYYYGIYTTAGTRICFARGGTSGNIYLNGTANSSFVNSRFSGSVTEDSVPSAPGISAVTNISTTNGTSPVATATLNWTAPADSGQNTDDSYTATQITGYNIVYREGTTATTPYSVWNGNTGTNGLSLNLSSGLLQNTTYQFRVAALNRTTNAIQATYTTVQAQTGVRSSIIQFRTLAAGPAVTANSYTSTAKIGVAYSSTPSVTVATPGTNGSTTANQPASYTLSGTLPPGLSFNTTTGAITGTPTKDATTTYSYTASYTFSVLSTNADGVQGAYASQTITVSGGTPFVSPTAGAAPTTRTTPKIWNGSSWVDATVLAYNPSKTGGAGWDVLS